MDSVVIGAKIVLAIIQIIIGLYFVVVRGDVLGVLVVLFAIVNTLL